MGEKYDALSAEQRGAVDWKTDRDMVKTLVNFRQENVERFRNAVRESYATNPESVEGCVTAFQEHKARLEKGEPEMIETKSSFRVAEAGQSGALGLMMTPSAPRSSGKRER